MKLEIIDCDESREIVPYRTTGGLVGPVQELAIGTKHASRLFVRSEVSGKLYVVDAPPELIEEFATIATAKMIASGEMAEKLTGFPQKT